jgi:hypothetical protein
MQGDEMDQHVKAEQRPEAELVASSLHLLILELSVRVLLIVTWLALGLRQVASAIEPVVGRFDVGRGNEKEPVIVLICEILAAE